MFATTDFADPLMSPGTDGDGSGVPDNNVFQNLSALFGSIAQDVGQTFRQVNTPTVDRMGNPVVIGTSGVRRSAQLDLLPVLLLVFAAWAILR